MDRAGVKTMEQDYRKVVIFVCLFLNVVMTLGSFTIRCGRRFSHRTERFLRLDKIYIDN